MADETWEGAEQAVAEGLADQIHGQDAEDPAAKWDLSVYARQPAPVQAAAYDDSAWDGAAAMAACSSAADYRAVCAGEHSAGSPDERQHWALPHHKSPGAAPNRAGVDNALSRLPQTQDLTNRSAAESHLHAHQRLWSGGESGNHWDAEAFLMAFEEA